MLGESLESSIRERVCIPRLLEWVAQQSGHGWRRGCLEQWMQRYDDSYGTWKYLMAYGNAH